MTGIFGHSNAEAKLRKHLAIPQDCSGGTCTKNNAHALFPVGTRSNKMAVRKTSIFGEVYLFSGTVVCAFSGAAYIAWYFCSLLLLLS